MTRLGKESGTGGFWYYSPICRTGIGESAAAIVRRYCSLAVSRNQLFQLRDRTGGAPVRHTTGTLRHEARFLCAARWLLPVRAKYPRPFRRQIRRKRLCRHPNPEIAQHMGPDLAGPKQNHDAVGFALSLGVGQRETPKF